MRNSPNLHESDGNAATWQLFIEAVIENFKEYKILSESEYGSTRFRWLYEAEE